MTIPYELLEYKQWVLWRHVEMDGRIAKLPISPWSGKAAASDKPQTWSTYRHVCYARRKFRSSGIGFVFTNGDPFCGIDLDQCRSPDGAITVEAQAVVERLASYTELSPSGTGVHILVKAKLPGPGRRSGKLEIYDSGRYFTITGMPLSHRQSSCIKDRQLQVDELIADLCRQRHGSLSGGGLVTSFASDNQLVECAKSARNGERFTRLWAGDTSEFGGDQSRADLALCRMLSFWCKGDLKRIDRLFRRSGLMRTKWDRLAGSLRYGERTILTVCSPEE